MEGHKYILSLFSIGKKNKILFFFISNKIIFRTQMDEIDKKNSSFIPDVHQKCFFSLTSDKCR